MRTLVVAGILAAFAVSSPRSETPLVNGVTSVGFTVSDVERAARFFQDVLSFETTSDREISGRPFELLQGVFGLRARVVTMRLGEDRIELTEYLAPRGRPIPADLRPNDRGFQHVAIIVSDMDRAYDRLRQHRVVHGSTGPQTLPASIPAAAGIRAFYFRDQDGHFLEVLQFPADKGRPEWHRRDRLFLGIDHTAIVVADTQASLHFYRDTLGLRVAGESENLGVEQEHLNNVFGARLRITALRADRGPGVELLEYIAPSNGRAAPADLQANDLLHWQTTMSTAMPSTADAALVRARSAFVSPGVVRLPNRDLGFTEGVMVRDPDGHAVRMVNASDDADPHSSR